MSSFPFHFRRIFLTDIKFMAYRSFLSGLEKCATFFWPPRFQMQNLLPFTLVYPCKYCIISLWLLSRFFSVVFSFQKINYDLLDVNVFGFILLGVFLASWICRFIFPQKFLEKFSALFFSNIILVSLSLFSHSGISMSQMLALLLLYHRFLILLLLFSVCFLSVFFR